MRATLFRIAEIVRTGVAVIAKAVINCPVAIVVLLVAFLGGPGVNVDISIIAIAAAIAATGRRAYSLQFAIAETVTVVVASLIDDAVTIVVHVITLLCDWHQSIAGGKTVHGAGPVAGASTELVAVLASRALGLLDRQERAIANRGIGHALRKLTARSSDRLAVEAIGTAGEILRTISSTEAPFAARILKAKVKEGSVHPRLLAVIIGGARVAQGQIAWHADIDDVRLCVRFDALPPRGAIFNALGRATTARFGHHAESTGAFLIGRALPEELTFRRDVFRDLRLPEELENLFRRWNIDLRVEERNVRTRRRTGFPGTGSKQRDQT